MIGETAHGERQHHAGERVRPDRERPGDGSQRHVILGHDAGQETQGGEDHQDRAAGIGSTLRQLLFRCFEARAGSFHFGVEVILSRLRGFYLGVLVLPVSRAGLSAFRISHVAQPFGLIV
jgi:hypothetical protein